MRDICYLPRHSVTLTVDLLTPKVDHLMPWPVDHTCANVHQNWFSSFQNTVFTSLVTDERTNEQTSRKYCASCQSSLVEP